MSVNMDVRSQDCKHEGQREALCEGDVVQFWRCLDCGYVGMSQAGFDALVFGHVQA
jgi:hypothetical protein